MSWRDKVQAMRASENSQKCPNPSLPKPPKPSSVSFGSTPPTHFQEKTGFSGHPAAANESASSEPVSTASPTKSSPAVTELPDPDRWCWPHSEAMTGREINTFSARTIVFNRRGMPSVNAEALAYKLVNRDRDGDDRRLCLECVHLSGQRGAWRCNQWQQAGMGAAGIPAGLVLMLQRCDSFKDQNPKRTT
jgi:hypothetical protein